MTSSHDARQDWQASVLRDLAPAEPKPSEPDFDDSAETKIVNPADFGITAPIQTQPPSPAPEPAADPLPDEFRTQVIPSSPSSGAHQAPEVHASGAHQAPEAQPASGVQESPTPAYPQPQFSQDSISPFVAQPAAPAYPGYPGPTAYQPPVSSPDPAQPPAPAQPLPSPGYPQQPAAYPQNPAYGQPQPYVPPQQQYPVQAYGGPQYGNPQPVAYPAPQQPGPQQSGQQQPGSPQGPQVPGSHDLAQGPSRVFGPEATPIPQEWTPDGLLDMPTHADNWHQRLRSSVRGVGGSAAKASREAAELARELTAPVTTGRRIAVLGIRGGSGKSTVASLLVSAYATHRGDRVLAVDADPDLGSLGLRLGASSPTSLAGLGKVPRVWQTLDEAERCLGRSQSGAWILSGERSSATPETVTPNAYLGVVHGISRYFAVTVVDAGAGMVTPLNQSVLADAHAIVLATPASIDGVVSARRALEWVRQWSPPRLAQTVVALTAMSPQAADIDLARTAEALAPFGVTPALIPYDRHLAAGATIEPWRLGERTRNAAVQLAAGVLSKARAV